MSKITKQVVDSLIDEIQKRPDDFIFGRYALVDLKTKYEYWVANGRFNGGIHEPFKMKFGMWQSLRFHRAVQALKVYQAQFAFETRGK